MEFIEDKIVYYREYCEEDYRGLTNKNCRLNGEEILEIENYLSLATLFKNDLLSSKMKSDFVNELNNHPTKLSFDELMELLLKEYHLPINNKVKSIFKLILEAFKFKKS